MRWLEGGGGTVEDVVYLSWWGLEEETAGGIDSLFCIHGQKEDRDLPYWASTLFIINALASIPLYTGKMNRRWLLL